VTWFADATLGGGPPDGFLKVHLVVVPQGAPIDAGAPETDAGKTGSPTPGKDGGSSPPLAGEDGGPGGVGDATGTGPNGGGCSVGTRSPASGAGALLVLGVAMIAGARRRRGRRGV
ncbi:MAG TPA: MYXO-CTERM sorting domain-containing protein, partial [Polyangiaceae bacterium]|jgi:MYXO-CTERM domain-containing protein